eukprot:TRINITY_DN29210_c0_g1_i1.p1 TRINITY_DN29210_c0_g1~~TRINITY_DN29210_c0_g1_i1.p1  ORF type:complete len:109 (-),score=6.48 TRINITY_DN29210_c0_g1_i1:559-885(-)
MESGLRSQKAERRKRREESGKQYTHATGSGVVALVSSAGSVILFFFFRGVVVCVVFQRVVHQSVGTWGCLGRLDNGRASVAYISNNFFRSRLINACKIRHNVSWEGMF